MKCCRCGHVLNTRYAYYVARISNEESSTGQFCSVCWNMLVANAVTRGIVRYMRELRSPAGPVAPVWVQDELPVTTP